MSKQTYEYFPCLRTIAISKKMWILTYFGPVTVDSVEGIRHFAFWRHKTRLATFFIAPTNYIVGDVSIEPIKNLATLVPEKLQVFPLNPPILSLHPRAFLSTR